MPIINLIITQYLSVFSPNAAKYGAEKVTFQTVFMSSFLFLRIKFYTAFPINRPLTGEFPKTAKMFL